MPRKRKGGGPARHPGEVLAKNRTFRVRGKLDAMLSKAAVKSGRSVSEQIEYMLETFFHDERLTERFMGSSVAAELLRLVRGACALAGVDEGDWAENRDRAEALRVSINAVIAVLTNLPIDLPPAESELRQGGNRLAAFLLASSSVRLNLPPWLLSYPEAGRLQRS